MTHCVKTYVLLSDSCSLRLSTELGEDKKQWWYIVRLLLGLGGSICDAKNKGRTRL